MDAHTKCDVEGKPELSEVWNELLAVAHGVSGHCRDELADVLFDGVVIEWCGEWNGET